METRILVLGAGFGGLELATVVSDALGEDAGITLIDASEAFVFGYAKLDVMFGRSAPDSVRLPYSSFRKPGVRFLRETVRSIDPGARRVTTDAGVHEADVLVVALGADYDFDATPGLVEGGNEFYSVAGAERLRELLPAFDRGHAVVGVCGAPFKCPPAPSEAALLLHDLLVRRGVRDACEISLVMPFGTPVPPSPDTSAALLEAFAERGIAFVSGRRVAALDPARGVVALDDGERALVRRLPRRSEASGAAGRARERARRRRVRPVDSRTLQTRFPDVYALGDVGDGRRAEGGRVLRGEARVVADALVAGAAEASCPGGYEGGARATSSSAAGGWGGSTWTSSPGRNRPAHSASRRERLVAEKQDFGASRRLRWFG